jgi:phage gpG-like protein
MSDPITITLSPAAVRLLAAAKNFPVAQLARAIDRENQFTVGYIQRNKLSLRGPTTLGVVTNRLRSSIRASKAVNYGDVIESGIGSNVVYAGIHEFGGTTRPHVIEAKNGKALSFRLPSGATICRRRVNHPGSKIPARHYIENSIRERMPAISEALSKVVLGILGGPNVV